MISKIPNLLRFEHVNTTIYIEVQAMGRTPCFSPPSAGKMSARVLPCFCSSTSQAFPNTLAFPCLHREHRSMRTRALVSSLCHILPSPVRNSGCVQGVDCDKQGLTIRELPVKEGYWRAACNVAVIRKCSSEVCMRSKANFLPQGS